MSNDNAPGVAVLDGHRAKSVVVRGKSLRVATSTATDNLTAAQAVSAQELPDAPLAAARGYHSQPMGSVAITLHQLFQNRTKT